MLELRASKIGGCVRSYVLDLRKGERPITDRQKIYFGVGKALEPVITENAGYPLSALFRDEVEVRIEILPNLVITGHPDGEWEDWVLECKTMRSLAYRKMVKNGLESQFPQYLIQGSVYAKGRDKEGVKFLCLDKDTSYIQEIAVPWSTLTHYWDIAKDNAMRIAQWVDKERLPGRDPNLPSWYCLESYCDHQECRFHMMNRKKSRVNYTPTKGK